MGGHRLRRVPRLPRRPPHPQPVTRGQGVHAGRTRAFARRRRRRHQGSCRGSSVVPTPRGDRPSWPPGPGADGWTFALATGATFALTPIAVAALLSCSFSFRLRLCRPRLSVGSGVPLSCSGSWAVRAFAGPIWDKQIKYTSLALLHRRIGHTPEIIFALVVVTGILARRRPRHEVHLGRTKTPGTSDKCRYYPVRARKPAGRSALRREPRARNNVDRVEEPHRPGRRGACSALGPGSRASFRCSSTRKASAGRTLIAPGDGLPPTTYRCTS